MDVYGLTLSTPAYSQVKKTSNSLFQSMGRLSSGERINRPGDAPADFGISEMLRFQINGADASSRNIENALQMMGTADAWLQETQNILGRMSELTIAATDGSKSQTDRENLNQEYLQLKAEISRISKDAKFNGIQVANREQILSYDRDLETFVFSQLDGGEQYSLPDVVISGVNGGNGIDFLFDSANDYTLSKDGEYIYYIDNTEAIVKYDIDKGTLERDAVDTEQKTLDVDEKGNLWYSRETAPGSGTYLLRSQELGSWTQDTSELTDADITDMGSSTFKVYEDRVSYVDTGGDLVSRSLRDFTDVQVLVSNADFTLGTTPGQHALSEGGKYYFDMPAADKIRVINSTSQKISTFNLDPTINVSEMEVNADGSEVHFIDSTTNKIMSLKLERGDQPNFREVDTILESSGSLGFSGLSFDGGSHRANFKVHQGPDHSQESQLIAGDVRLYSLGILDTSLDGAETAADALERVHRAIDMVSMQRSIIGANSSRMNHTYEALTSYSDSVSAAESVIRDTNVAKESAEMLDLRVRHEMAISILAQSGQIRGKVVQQLLNR